jgi:hypothetical protein
MYPEKTGFPPVFLGFSLLFNPFRTNNLSLSVPAARGREEKAGSPRH